MARHLLLWTLLAVITVAAIQMTAIFREMRAEARNPPAGELMDVDGTDVHAVVMGEGPDLILIHGASGSTHDFTFSLMEELAERYRVIALDRPGLGWTDRLSGYGGAWRREAESPKEQVALLRAAAEQLGVTRPIVLGHSYGGALAMAWALEDPDTAAVVMLGAVSHPWPGDLGWQYTVMAHPAGGALLVPLFTAFTPRRYVETVVGSIFAPQDPPPAYVAQAATGLAMRRGSLRANARQVNSLRPHVVEMAEDYPRLSLPIEIVHGDADTIVPLDVHSRPLADRVESAHLTVLEGIGHMPHHAAEAEVIAAIDRAANRAGLR